MRGIVAALERFYGPLAVPPDDPFRAYVWEVLATQATPARRDAAYGALQRIPALTPDAMFRAPRLKLTQAVALAGPYQEPRLQALLTAVARFRRQPGLSGTVRGRLWAARRAIEPLPRLGEGSVHRLLLFGGGHAIVPVDRDTARLAIRLGVSDEGHDPAGTARKARRALQAVLPGDAAALKHAALYLRHHAQHTCTEEPHCRVCPLSDQCPSARAFPDVT